MADHHLADHPIVATVVGIGAALLCRLVVGGPPRPVAAVLGLVAAGIALATTSTTRSAPAGGGGRPVAFDRVDPLDQVDRSVSNGRCSAPPLPTNPLPANPLPAATAAPPRVALDAFRSGAGDRFPPQCPSCASYAVARDAEAFSCRRCGAAWLWHADEPWPSIRVDPRPPSISSEERHV